ncbi:MAG: proteasome assembly chaperone family protein [Haloarculaceae archaeon]
MPREPAFEVELTGETEPGETLLVGMAGRGVAGLTAADYLVTHVETTQIGHVTTQNLPDITPFSEGVPRHPIRLYSTANSDVTVLIGELFPPVWVADALADALLDWIAAQGLREITVLAGEPFPHSEEEHVVFHVATDEYRTRHFGDGATDVPPLQGGFFDGVVGELLVRAIDGDAPPTGVLVTPTHIPGPDLNAALRLLEALGPVCGIEVAEDELRERADEMEQYYQSLAERMRAMEEGQSTDRQEYPGDRMYM